MPVTTEKRLEIPPYDFAAAQTLERELGVGHAIAQILVRRGLREPARAREWLDAAESHPPGRFAGIERAVETIRRHVAAGSPITVHGDYDVDGVCSTAILVRALRALGARVDWFLPSRRDDGYGLSVGTVERLARRGTRLLITADCAITAVDEVAAARASGIDVVVTDHHRPRADGRLPDAPIVHPALCGYPCADLCATAVAYKLAAALGADVEDDLDLVALATVADCVPLQGENRALVRAGLRVLAASGKPGLRALMRVAQLDPGSVDAHAIGFRLAPRINAAGRLYRADAGLELLLTGDERRAEEIAAELDAANAQRRDVETRILFEAEAQVAEAGDRHAYVLAGEDWHAGVIGIVASRLAERHWRPVVLVALDGDHGVGSGRSIPGYDLLGGLAAAAPALERHGGHAAAAGLELRRERLDDLRSAFEGHAAGTLTAEDLVPRERVDAVVGGDELTLSLAEQLRALEPFGAGNPEPVLLVPAASLTDPRPLSEGKHARFTLRAGGVRARALAFGGGARLPVADDAPADATFGLSVSSFNGTVEAKLVLRCAQPSHPRPIEVLGEPESYIAGVRAELGRALEPWPPAVGGDCSRNMRDRRGAGIAGTIGDLVAAGEPLLVVCADVARRVAALAPRLGGFALCSYHALESDPRLSAPYPHVVALDAPAHEHEVSLLALGGAGSFTHMAWGDPELRFSHQIHEQEYGLRAQLATLYRGLRDRGGAEGEELEAVLRGDARWPRSPALAGRLLRVLEELRLVSLDRDRMAVSVPPAERTALERSAAFIAYQTRYRDGQRYLSSPRARAA